MTNLQHERITALAQELRLTALSDLYGPIAQNAAKRKDASFADFLEEVLKAEREARRARAPRSIFCEMMAGLDRQKNPLDGSPSSQLPTIAWTCAGSRVA